MTPKTKKHFADAVKNSPSAFGLGFGVPLRGSKNAGGRSAASRWGTTKKIVPLRGGEGVTCCARAPFDNGFSTNKIFDKKAG